MSDFQQTTREEFPKQLYFEAQYSCCGADVIQCNSEIQKSKITAYHLHECSKDPIECFSWFF